MNDVNNQNLQDDSKEVITDQQTVSVKKKSYKLLIIIITSFILVISLIILYFIFYYNKGAGVQDILEDVSSGLPYYEPCSTGDKEGCIMEKVYAKIKKSSSSDNYTIIWDEAFKECEKYPNDISILYYVNQCKMDVCDNLSLGDGNLKYNYPEEEECREEAMRTCPDGDIINNIPCACDVPAGPYAVYDEYWLDNYWNKVNHQNNYTLYCCSGKQQEKPCN